MVCRLARLGGHPSPPRLQQQTASPQVPARDAALKKSTARAASTVAQAVAGFTEANAHNSNAVAVCKEIAARLGTLAPRELTALHAVHLVNVWRQKYTHGTTYARRGALVRFLHWLETYHGSPPGVAALVPEIPPPPIRQICVTDAERAAILDAAHIGMRLFIHLCADLGLRHQTALNVTYGGWDKERGTLTFTTKGHRQQTLPLTQEVTAILRWLPDTTPPGQSIVAAIWPNSLPVNDAARRRYAQNEWLKLRHQLGLRAELHIHDLRRHAAESMWEVTHDLRKVQAFLGHESPTTTARYLAQRINAADLAPDLRRAVAAKNRLLRIPAVELAPKPKGVQ